MKYSSIILDLDGTLWDATEVISIAWNQVIRQAKIKNVVLSKEILKEQFGKTMKEISNNLFGTLLPEERQSLMAECCKQQQKALLHTTENLLYPGVRETLRELSRNHKIYMVSNCQSGYMELFLRKYNLEQYITDMECYGNNGNDKGTNIKLIVSRNQMEAPVYVGDTVGDQQAAAYAKVPFIYAAYGYGNVTGYMARIEEFSQLLSIVR